MKSRENVSMPNSRLSTSCKPWKIYALVLSRKVWPVTDVELSDDEIVVLDVVNASEHPEPKSRIARYALCLNHPNLRSLAASGCKHRREVSFGPDQYQTSSYIGSNRAAWLIRLLIDLRLNAPTIARDKFEAATTPKRKTLKKRAEEIVHPAHKGAIPIKLGEGDGLSRAEVRITRLKAELDLSPQALPPLPVES